MNVIRSNNLLSIYHSLSFMFQGQEKDRQIIEARRMLTEELPHDNYQVLKFILDLLEEVSVHLINMLLYEKRFFLQIPYLFGYKMDFFLLQNIPKISRSNGARFFMDCFGMEDPIL